MKFSGLLIYYHCKSNTGYAIGRHEPDFLKMAEILTGSIDKVHVAYANLEGGHPEYLPRSFKNVIEFDSKDGRRESLNSLYDYIKSNGIDVAFGFDQPVSAPAYAVMRKAGINLLVSYWGAPMSSLNSGIKLMAKKIEVRLRRHRPDHFIFQSKAMADTAIFGRGISSRNVSIIPNAVDTNIFCPDAAFVDYAHQAFSIPKDRKIVFYSGHMEERKGVHVIVKAATELICNRRRKDVHFVFLGNVGGEEEKFAPIYLGTPAESHITFGGYRDDVSKIHKSCYLGVIATTGWDSFTMSSMEMASSGLPLIVSDLQGLKETVIDEKTGYLNAPGDHLGLATKIEKLLDNPPLRNAMGASARQRVIDNFSLEDHIRTLVDTVRKL